MQWSSPAEGRSYLAEDTIAARITGPGGAVSALRVSGPDAARCLNQLCGESFDASAQPRVMRHVVLRARDGRALDDALVAFFSEHKSFTGEPVAELFLHGGTLVSEGVLEELRALGCRPALPGEFSFRAVRNGKMTLDQAQAVRDLIEAPNRTAQGLALERLGGRHARLFESHAEILRQVLASAEAGIDFSDQEIDELGLGAWRLRLAPALAFLVGAEASLERGRRIQEGVGVVLAGLPNAGKSTLFNELLGADRSLISDEAGTTRDVIREQLRLRGVGQGGKGSHELSLVLHDTAGLRGEAGRVEQMGIDRTRAAVAEADLVLFAVASGSDALEVKAEWARLGAPAHKTLLVLTKADLSRGDLRSEREVFEAALGVGGAVPVSAQSGQGLQDLTARLASRAEQCAAPSEGGAILTRPEQQDAVRKAREALERGLLAPGHELLAADLREALEHLSFFIGKTPTDEILGRIFSQFCIGK